MQTSLIQMKIIYEIELFIDIFFILTETNKKYSQEIVFTQKQICTYISSNTTLHLPEGFTCSTYWRSRGTFSKPLQLTDQDAT